MKKAVIFLFLILSTLVVAAQHPDSGFLKMSDTNSLLRSDSLKSTIVKSIKKIATNKSKQSLARFKEDIIATKQDGLIDDILRTAQQARSYLKIGIDTTSIITNINQVASLYEIIGDGIFTNKGTVQTNRNLATSSILFHEVLDKTLATKHIVDKYYKNLVNFRNRLDSLGSTSILYEYPSDTVLLAQYLQKLEVASMDINPTIAALKSTLFRIKAIQTGINFTTTRLSSRIEELDAFQQNLVDKIYDRELPNLGGVPQNYRPFTEIVRFSLVKLNLLIYFYAHNNRVEIGMLLLLFIASAIFLRSLKRQMIAGGLLTDDLTSQLVFRYPTLSAILIISTVFQFIFPRPPFIFSAILWTISSLSLFGIFLNYIAKFWMRAYIIMTVLFLLVCLDNLILQASRPERWIMLVLASAGAVFGSFVLLKGKKEELKDNRILYFVGAFVVIELASVVYNICGRYNLSKTLLGGGFFNVVIAILFLWVVKLTDQALSWAFNIYKVPEKRSFYVNFNRVGRRSPFFFYVLMFAGWGYLLGRNFYIFRSVFITIRNFLIAQKTVGNYSFSIYSILVFFFIIILSSLISKIVSFFASDKYDVPVGSNKTGGSLTSWLLLIRIAIISIGLFIAFAAAGIPTDRITIILSALGVGIGFGLQTLINNLVSGLIISFERPVNVGDIIELGDKGGIMKSIGFRSSIISTWDGADVIIPNGDLLNQHLVNWTLDNRIRRVGISFGVAYGTDLVKTKKIIDKLIVAEKRILEAPAPLTVLKELGSGAIAVQIYFWVRNIEEWTLVKSDIIAGIDAQFRKNKIVIPFPQEEVHLRSVISEPKDTAK
ncbi:mechanosensitive ion channel family protein [Mucilaginibacter sp. AW1-3]